ncbi:MAG: nucleotidyl transferase AbiEii/AbiGii toxin family protein [Coprothermobacterota bacterium]|nr:nucleotidyl transferase AbiEii/AbiGii toxin family protein [Coprothermobacterota bacterium]
MANLQQVTPEERDRRLQVIATPDKGTVGVASSRSMNWHYEILSPQTKKALDFLSEEAWLAESKWYLAGGTALALQAGTRKSFDLDFFTSESEFDGETLLANFLMTPDWRTEWVKKNTIYGELFGSKISFLANPLFLPGRAPIRHGAVSVLAAFDIAVMKIIAISQRGRKRDFYDLYWCARNLEGLKDLILHLPAQYPSVAHNYHHILKSLVYFQDADSDPDPMIYFQASWEGIRSFFQREMPQIARTLIIQDG